MRLSILSLVLVVFLLLGSVPAWADSIILNPTTWYQIDSSVMGGLLTVKPDSMLVTNAGGLQSKAFWEFDLTSLSSVTSAFIDINRLINPLDHNTDIVQLMTYKADANPTLSDWDNFTIYDTAQNKGLYEGDNNFDITTGLQYALANNYQYFGVFIYVPSSNLHVPMYVDSQAVITLNGTAIPVVPEPATLVLMGIGIVGLAGWKMRRKSVN